MGFLYLYKCKKPLREQSNIQGKENDEVYHKQFHTKAKMDSNRTRDDSLC